MKNKKTIILIVFIFILNISVFAGWFYLFSTIRGNMVEIVNTRRDLALVEKKMESRRSLKDMINGLSKERKKINSVFFNTDTMVNFIESLEGMARQTGVSLEFNSITINKKTKTGPLFRFQLSGDFGKVFRYFSLLENMPFPVIVKKAHIKTENKEWVADFDVVLTTFVYEQDKGTKVKSK